MTTLKYVREIKDSRLLLLGLTEEGESARYTVNCATYEDIGSPAVGDELDVAQLSAIKHTDEYIRAKKKALNILAYTDNSKKNLASKLYHAGFEKEIVSDTIAEMESYGYVNEQRQLERIIIREANEKLRGPKKIMAFAMAKGYASSDIREVMHRLVDAGEIDFSKNAKRLIDKKLSCDADGEEKKKLLYKNGFKI